MKKAKVASVALLIAAGLLIGVGTGEFLLGVLAPQIRRIPRLWQYDAELGWAHIPHARARMVTPEFSVEVAMDAAGLRDRQRSRTRTPGAWRLLALGDSFVEGWGVPLASAVTQRLEAELRRRGALRPVEVINLGVAGYGTDQELLLFQRLGRQYHPDDVLVFFYVNDYWNNASATGIGTQRGYKPLFQATSDGRLILTGVPVRRLPWWDVDWRRQRPWRARAWRYLRRNWHVAALIQRAFFAPAMPREQRRRFYAGLYGVDVEGRWQQQWELSGRLLQELASRVTRAGATLHVVYVPARIQVDPEERGRRRELRDLVGPCDLRKPNRQLASFAARYGWDYLDLYDAFQKESASQRLYFRDSHWNARGHALAAARIADHLLAAGTPESAPGRRP